MKKLTILVTVMLFLVGCTTTQIKSTSLSTNKPLEKDHGVIAIKVVNNTGQLSMYHDNWTEIIAFRTDNVKEVKAAAIAAAKEKAKKKGKKFDESKVDWNLDVYSLSPMNRGSVDTQVFVGSVPAGEYVISKLYAYFNNGEVSSWLTMPVRFAAGNFTIKANQFADLGTIVFQPLLNTKERTFWSQESSRRAYVTRMKSLNSLSDFVKSNYPKITKTLSFSAYQPWQDDVLIPFRKQLSDLSRSRSYASSDTSISGTGDAALTAKFGQVRILKDNGQWQQLNIPTNNSVSSLTTHQGKVIAGSEYGEIYIQQENGWERIQPLPNTEAIVWFGRLNKKLIALTQSIKNYTFYEVLDINNNWQEIGNFKRKNANSWLVQNGGLFPIITKDGQLRVINDNKIYNFTPTTGKWIHKKSTSLRKMTQLPNGYLVALEVSQWDGIGDQVISLDGADSWITLTRTLKTIGDNKTDASLPVIQGNKIITLGRDNHPNKKKRLKGLRIISQDISNKIQRKAWTIHDEAKATCHTMLPHLSNKSTLYFLCDQGEIVSTSDLGKTWTTAIDNGVAEMQNSFEAMLKSLKDTAEKKRASSPKQAAN